MEINKLSNVSGVSRINAVQQTKTDEGSTQISQKQDVSAKQDVVDLSTAANSSSTPATDVTFSGMKVNGIRTDLVNRIRAEIAAGTYETPEKLEIAFQKMFDSLGE